MLVTRHVVYAIPTVLLSLFSQSMVIFFFIGTGPSHQGRSGRFSGGRAAQGPRGTARVQAEDLAARDFRHPLGHRGVRPRRGGAHARAAFGSPSRGLSRRRRNASLGASGGMEGLPRQRPPHGEPGSLRAHRGRPGIELGSMTAGLLEGRTALVTGAGVRVGRAIALALGGAGADVAVHYNASAGPAGETASALRALGRRASTHGADLSDPAACAGLVREAIASLGSLDLLVHSAANFHRAALSDTDAALWDDAMNVNARAAMLLAREAAPMLRERKGRVVLVTDLLAVQPARALPGALRLQGRGGGARPRPRRGARSGGLGQRSRSGDRPGARGHNSGAGRAMGTQNAAPEERRSLRRRASSAVPLYRSGLRHRPDPARGRRKVADIAGDPA